MENKAALEAGMLYLVPTPIGNLEDMTVRAVRVLKEADLIAAEDTRNSLKLLTHFDIHTPMVSYHEYNKYDRARELTEKMLSGQTVAVITDAGTPGISDPGEELVRCAAQAGIRVSALPGACAGITALVMSGLPTRRFDFEGFLPQKKKERKEALERLKEICATIILYEAPHHLKDTLEDLETALGDRKLAVVRELTKIHEEVLRMTIREAREYYKTVEPRGEYVLVLDGADEEERKKEQQQRWEKKPLSEHVGLYMEQGMDRKQAMKAAAADRGLTRREVYQRLLEEEEKTGEESSDHEGE